MRENAGNNGTERFVGDKSQCAPAPHTIATQGPAPFLKREVAGVNISSKVTINLKGAFVLRDATIRDPRADRRESPTSSKIEGRDAEITAYRFRKMHELPAM